jgi:hypothetical protein
MIFLFARKALVFQKKDRREWERAQAALAEAGIRARAGSYTPESEITCG